MWERQRPSSFGSRIKVTDVASSGKWLVPLPAGDPDDLWGALAGRAGTRLTAVKRSSARLDAKLGHGLVCVYCEDSSLRTVVKTLNVLREIGVVGALEYKTDLATHQGRDDKLYLSPAGTVIEGYETTTDEETSMQRTPGELQDLKDQWMADPAWDIEETEGFENHREELAAFSKDQYQKWADERLRRQERRAEELGCEGNLKLVAYVERLEARLVQIEEALDRIREASPHDGPTFGRS